MTNNVIQIQFTFSGSLMRNGGIPADILFDEWNRRLHILRQECEEQNAVPAERPHLEILPRTGDYVRMMIVMRIEPRIPRTHTWGRYTIGSVPSYFNILRTNELSTTIW